MNTHATQVISALGETAEVARMFRVSMPSVSDWKQNGIPPARMMYLKVAHKKRLAGIDLTAATAKRKAKPTKEVAHG
jgi:hypothetical protein